MTDKIKVEKLAEMKERENRDLDTLVNENTLVAGETGAGVFGVFKFFQGIRNFFKGIQALGTLVTTSKIPVLQDDGSLKFTTPAEITSGLATTTELNNALTNLSKVKIIQISDCNNAYPDENGKKETYFADGTAINTPSNSLLWFIESERFFYSNNWRITQVAISQSASATNKPQQYIRHGTYVPSSSTWTWGEWEKVTTETDVNNALAKYGKIQKVRLVSKTTRTFTLETNHIYQLVISHTNDTSYNGLYIISNQTTLNTVTSNSKYTLSFESNVVSIYNSGTGNPTAFLTDLGKVA